MTPGAPAATIVDMTKHASGKYGRTVGNRERKALVSASNGVWCYMCEASHRWSRICAEKAAAARAQLAN